MHARDGRTTWSHGGLAVVGAMLLTACADAPPSAPPPPAPPTDDTTSGDDGWDLLAARVLDYNHALRTASLKLVQALPTLERIRAVELSVDPQAAYELEIDAMLADHRFRRRMLRFWRDTMRQGGPATLEAPSRDTAPALAARIVVEQRPFSELFTSAANNCPTFDGASDTFVDGECDAGAPVEAGVLTDPGAMHQFYGNMAFRRVRWVQEIFVCTKFPAEHADAPTDIDGAQYLSPWPMSSIASSPIAFDDTESVVCANCHTTMNHVAPLFARFDQAGQWQDTIQVLTPTVPAPVPTELGHWLAAGEQTAWRFGQPVADLAELGEALAADPAVAECAVARFWNLVMSKEDIVTDLATVPREVLAPYLTVFESEGENLRAVLRAMLTSDDFVRR